MKATEPIFICSSSAALKAYPRDVFPLQGPSFEETISVDHHHSLNGTMVLWTDPFSFACTLELFVLVASPRCKHEQWIVNAL